MEITQRELDFRDVIADGSAGVPETTIEASLRRLERILLAYGRKPDAGGATAQALLSEIEGLRGFAMTPGALRDGLRRCRPNRPDPLGISICQALRGMVTGITEPSMVTLHAERRALNRTGRRAISCLAFVGALDRTFIGRDDGSN
jgi:hypothetical protein